MDDAVKQKKRKLRKRTKNPAGGDSVTASGLRFQNCTSNFFRNLNFKPNNSPFDLSGEVSEMDFEPTKSSVAKGKALCEDDQTTGYVAA